MMWASPPLQPSVPTLYWQRADTEPAHRVCKECKEAGSAQKRPLAALVLTAASSGCVSKEDKGCKISNWL